MLTQEEVKRYAHARRLRLLDHIWKDYVQDVSLYLLYRRMPRMVFGGGTCIWKTMKGDRFSEDIDAYSRIIPEDLHVYLSKELSLLGIACRFLKRKKMANMLFFKLALSFLAHPREITVSIEILSGSPKETENTTMHSPYPDVPPVEMVVLAPERILANKVSAVCGRNKPRDVHDLYFLLKSGTKIDAKLVRQAVPRFSMKSFEKALLKKQPDWQSLKPLVVTKLPQFMEELEYILSSFAAAGLK